MKFSGNERPENDSGNDKSQPWTEHKKSLIRIADADYRNSAQPAKFFQPAA
jgi:hypothetical protein